MREAATKARISQMIQQDKEEMNEGTYSAALKDFNRVAGEYFEREGDTIFEVKRGRNGYEVSICFRAARVKNFTLLK